MQGQRGESWELRLARQARICSRKAVSVAPRTALCSTGQPGLATPPASPGWTHMGAGCWVGLGYRLFCDMQASGAGRDPWADIAAEPVPRVWASPCPDVHSGCQLPKWAPWDWQQVAWDWKIPCLHYLLLNSRLHGNDAPQPWSIQWQCVSGCQKGYRQIQLIYPPWKLEIVWSPTVLCVPGGRWCMSLVTFPPWHSALQKLGHWFHFYTDVKLSANLAYSEVFSGKFYTTPLVWTWAGCWFFFQLPSRSPGCLWLHELKQPMTLKCQQQTAKHVAEWGNPQGSGHGCFPLVSALARGWQVSLSKTLLISLGSLRIGGPANPQGSSYNLGGKWGISALLHAPTFICQWAWAHGDSRGVRSRVSWSCQSFQTSVCTTPANIQLANQVTHRPRASQWV